RGDCPLEAAEQVTFFNQLRARHPGLGRIALHPRNERKRHARQATREKLEGMSPGAPDIIIPGAQTFCCELKRRDHTKSRWSKHQLAWLEAAQEAGAYVCVALGWEAAWAAMEAWLQGDHEGTTEKNKPA